MRIGGKTGGSLRAGLASAAALVAAASLCATTGIAGETTLTGMVPIPGGPFAMGRDDGPADERPASTVTLPLFHIDRTPVTNAAFAAFLDRAGPADAHGIRLYDHDDPDARIHLHGGRWRADEGYETHPAVEVTWAGARAYCAHVGKRLPTEAEWEKAARGTDARRHPWGDSPPSPERARHASGWNATVPAGSLASGASPYGVLDMAGNVWQWVSSAYRPYPYSAQDGREDPAPGPVRGTRGGGHDSPADAITTTQRGRALSRNPAAGHHNIGFRCAR